MDAEIEAFLARFNYFLQEPRVWIKATKDWLTSGFPASERQLRGALDDETPLSLRASYTTSFLGIDIDLSGKDEPKSEEAFQRLRELRSSGETSSVGVSTGPSPTRSTTRPVVGAELVEAIKIVMGCFLVPPSLIVRTPHGAHLYWCLVEVVSWQTQIKLNEYLIKDVVHARMNEEGVQRKIEVLPSPSHSLRIPSRGRALDPITWGWDRTSATGADFWLNLPGYRWEDVIDRKVLLKERRTIVREKNRIAALIQGMEGESRPSIVSVVPASLDGIVFTQGESDQSLKTLVRGAKAQGFSEESTLALVKDRLATSMDHGYKPEADMQGTQLERRVLSLFRNARSGIDPSKNRYQAIWDLPVDVSVREEWVDWALSHLKARGLLPAEASEARVVRFLQDLDRWMLKVDHAIKHGLSPDPTLIRAVGRHSYPFPKFLLTRWYSRYTSVWKALQEVGAFEKDPLVGYVPDLHRPQFYLRTPPGSPAGSS